MNCLTLFASYIVMYFTVQSYAQKMPDTVMQWQIAAQLPATQGRAASLGLAGPVVGIHHNVLMIAGGANFPGKMPWEGGAKKYYAQVYAYKLNGKSITLYNEAFILPESIAYAASCSTPHGVLYAGGENENGISSKVVLLKWNEVTEKIKIEGLPDLPVAVTNASITVKKNLIFIAGGETSVEASDHFYCLDLHDTRAGWKEMPSIPIPVSHSVLAVQSNGVYPCVYLVGGRKKNANGISEIYEYVYEFDLKKNEWSRKASMPYGLCAGTGIATGRNSLLMFGGDKGETFNKVEALIAAINDEKDDAKRLKLIDQKKKLQVSHPGFSKEILMYNTAKDSWSKQGVIPFDVPVTTTACRWKSDVIICGGEIKAGIRTPQILVGKLNTDR